MQRIRLTVRYDGTGFSGSQIQPGKRTVSGTLTECLESELEQQVHLLWAGRTDSGVHADGNVCTFDAETNIPADRLAGLLNPKLPPDLQVRDSRLAEPEFHPRFDAVSRSYLYRVFRGTDVPVDRQRYCAAVGGAWDETAVAEVLNGLAGTHSFNHYCHGSEEPEYTSCTLQPVETTVTGAELNWRFTANRFLRHMICRLAGVLIAAAGGQVTPLQVIAGLTSKPDFKYQPAPARGLTLDRVDYAG